MFIEKFFEGAYSASILGKAQQEEGFRMEDIAVCNMTRCSGLALCRRKREGQLEEESRKCLAMFYFFLTNFTKTFFIPLRFEAECVF